MAVARPQAAARGCGQAKEAMARPQEDMATLWLPTHEATAKPQRPWSSHSGCGQATAAAAKP